MNNHKTIKRSFNNQKICKGDKDKPIENLDRANFHLNDKVFIKVKDQVVEGTIIKILRPNVSRQYYGKTGYLVSYQGGKKILKKHKMHRENSCPCFALYEDYDSDHSDFIKE